MRKNLNLRIELLSDAIFSSGQSIPGGEDIALKTDSAGMPYLSGSTFKGLLRESVENLLCWTGKGTEGQGLSEALFGISDREAEISRRLVFGDFHISGLRADAEPPVYWRYFTALEDGLVKEGSLRMAACIEAGTVLEGILLCDEEDVSLVTDGIRGIKCLGLLRNRGFGSVCITVSAAQAAQEPAFRVESARWLHYRLRLETPLVATKQPEGGVSREKSNFTETHTYLPGAAVRGMAASALAEREPEWFEAHKEEILGGRIHFLNAYPQVKGQGTIPTPMGFYEDKAQTRFYSVVTTGKVKPGDKRAKLGKYCLLDGGKITAASPQTCGMLRIRRGADKQMFTIRGLTAGTVLEGYIYLEDPSFAEKLSEAFTEWLWMGADRYCGCGLCRTELLEASEGPYWLRYSASDSASDRLTMLLLSPLSMKEGGEPCGFSCTKLAERLGVEKVELESCSTSVTEESGYNRTWGCALPLERMYSGGSVFRLRCAPAPTAESLRRLEETGMGDRRSEGFGQVLFLKEYDGLQPERQGAAETPQLPKSVILRQARCRWLLDNKVPQGLSKSQLGSIQALLEDAIRQGGSRAALDEFLQHNLNERGSRHGFAFRETEKVLNEILEVPLWETLGTEPFEDTVSARMHLICDWLDLSRKGDVR